LTEVEEMLIQQNNVILANLTVILKGIKKILSKISDENDGNGEDPLSENAELHTADNGKAGGTETKNS